MKPQKFYLEIQPDGTLTNPATLKAFTDAVGHCRGRWMITLEKYYPARSLSQNKFYWYNIVPAEIEIFEQEWGETYSKDQMHTWNKTYFWGTEKVIEETGEVIKMPESSAAQTTVSWELKLEKCRQWFRQNFNAELPYPEQQVTAF